MQDPLAALKDRTDSWERHGPTPPVSLTMSIDSHVYSLQSGMDGRPNLSFTITCYLPHPITICTYHTALDESNAWRLDGTNAHFSATDVETNQQVLIKGGGTACRAYSLRRQLGDSDEEYYLTLQPGVPVTISHPIRGLQGWDDGIGNETFVYRCGDLRGQCFARYFEPGHKYRIGLAYRPGPSLDSEGKWKRTIERGPYQLILWWRYGIKEEVLEPKDTPSYKAQRGWSENTIRFSGIPDVELAIED